MCIVVVGALITATVRACSSAVAEGPESWALSVLGPQPPAVLSGVLPTRCSVVCHMAFSLPEPRCSKK